MLGMEGGISCSFSLLLLQCRLELFGILRLLRGVATWILLVHVVACGLGCQLLLGLSKLHIVLSQLPLGGLLGGGLGRLPRTLRRKSRCGFGLCRTHVPARGAVE